MHFKSISISLAYSFFLIIALSNQLNAQVFMEDQFLIQFKKDIQFNEQQLLNAETTELPAFDALNSRYNLQAVEGIGKTEYSRTYLLKFGQKVDVKQLIGEYKATGLFSHLEADYIATGGQSGGTPVTPNDSYFGNQWEHDNGQGGDLNTPLAWSIEQGDSNVVIAMIDTGVKLDHPEFSGRIWKNKNETPNGLDDDNNGKADDLQGWDFINHDNDPTDDEGHGTAMTGHLGANANNNFLYAGVDWHARLMICKAGNQNNGVPTSASSSAIYYAVDQGADVINMSFGGFSNSFVLHQAIQYADSLGVVLVACTGNNNVNQIWYPAAYPEVIAVGATDSRDNRAAPFFGTTGTGSNYGPQIDVVAPGDLNFGLDHLNNNVLFLISSGTSVSTAFVSGVCGLLLARNPALKPQQIRQILHQTAVDQVGPPAEDSLGFDSYFGYGLVDAYAALLSQTVSAENEMLLPSDVELFPNPADETINLKYNGGGSRLLIYDIRGKKLRQESIEKHAIEIQFKLTDLRKGVYLLRILDDQNKTMLTKKFIRH